MMTSVSLNKAKRIPNQREEEMMMREGLRIALMMILKNHTYEFNGKIEPSVPRCQNGLILSPYSKLLMRMNYIKINRRTLKTDLC